MQEEFSSNLNSTDSISHYEQSFASYMGEGTHAFSFWKGRVALYAILLALGIRKTDEVILPGYTCVVVPNAIRHCGAKPIYVDIEMNSFSINPKLVEEAITPRTKAIIIQHTYGIPGPIHEIVNIAKKHNLFVIEDSAHALGSKLSGKLLGTIGDAAFFSSQWSKPYTSGLGGIAVTTNLAIAEKIQSIKSDFVSPPLSAKLRLGVQFTLFSLFFSPRNYWRAQNILRKLSSLGVFVGSSSDAELDGHAPIDHYWKMSKYQEKISAKQLKKYEVEIDSRMEIMVLYQKYLSKAGFMISDYNKNTILLRYPLRVKNKWELLSMAQNAHVELGSWFETPLHPTVLEKHKIFNYKLGQCPIAEQAAEETINLPLHKWMTEDEAFRILNFVNEYAVGL
jgi:perosamine synthetase